MTGLFRKVVLVVIDGLRPDAITPERMPVLSDMVNRGWRAPQAVTVRPSVTVAALTSLASGVAPATTASPRRGSCTRHGYATSAPCRQSFGGSVWRPRSPAPRCPAPHAGWLERSSG